MATTTPNYDWPIPEDSDLVRDGAKAIRDLGNAIDTSAEDFGGGLIHIETQSPSGVAAVNFNDVFSANYNHYLIVGNLTNSAPTAVTNIRTRVSGTDAVTGYVKVNVVGTTSFAFSGRVVDGSATAAEISINTGNISKTFQTIVYKPFLSVNTEFETRNSAGPRFEFNAGALTNSNSYTGFTILVSTGTTTGTVSVYGYKV